MRGEGGVWRGPRTHLLPPLVFSGNIGVAVARPSTASAAVMRAAAISKIVRCGVLRAWQAKLLSIASIVRYYYYFIRFMLRIF